MSKAQPPYDDEVDLFDILETLWDGRKKIIATISVVALFGIILFLYLPKEYKLTAPISPAEDSVFLPYTSTNELLEKNGLPLKIDSTKVFTEFVSDFIGYEEMLNVLSANYYVINSLQGLDEVNKQKELIKLATSFTLKAPLKETGSWQLSFNWHDDLEGKRLLNNAIQRILNNIRLKLKEDVDQMILTLNMRKTLELNSLQAKLKSLKSIKDNRERYFVQYLREQASIARSLGIKDNQMFKDVNLQSQGEKDSNNSQTYYTYYLRGYLAIEEELDLIANRSEEQSMLAIPDYLDTLEQISLVKGDLSPSQLKIASKSFDSDNSKDWVKYNLELYESNYQIKTLIFVILSIVLAGMISAVYVIILNSFRKRKKNKRKI
jgi:LPS O-antigen subunit length determinant protein (WzzB/FepE family)